MARYLKFDLAMFGQDGLIPLQRGDDWLLSGKVVLLRGDQQDDADLTGISSATAVFPGATGTLVGAFTPTDAKSGKFNMTLPASASIQAMLSDAGINPYITVQEAGGLSTIYPFDPPPMKIQDRGFTNL